MGAMEIFDTSGSSSSPSRRRRRSASFVSAYLVPDEHMAGDRAERISRVQLVSRYAAPGLVSAVEGRRSRIATSCGFAFTTTTPDSPAFLEIKKRTTETVHKLRAVVPKPAAERLLQGGRLGACGLAVERRRIASGTDGVLRLPRSAAMPRAWRLSIYRREAYVSQTAESVRVTFDRHVAGHRYPAGRAWRPSRRRAAVMSQGRRAGAQVQRPGAAVDARPGDDVQSAAVVVSQVCVLRRCTDASIRIGATSCRGACDDELAGSCLRFGDPSLRRRWRRWCCRCLWVCPRPDHRLGVHGDAHDAVVFIVVRGVAGGAAGDSWR